MKFWTFTVILTLNIADQSFCMTLRLMMMHHNTKLGNKMFGGFEDIIWTNTDILTLRCHLDLECSNPIFFHATLWLLMMYHQTKFRCQGINSSDGIVGRLIFWSREPSLWPWPWRQQTIFPAWLMTLAHDAHYHTKFGNKVFCGSEDIIRTNIHWHFEP